MPKVKRREDSKGAILKLDVSMLNTIIQYLLCDGVQDAQRHTASRLIQSLDLEAYAYDIDQKDRLRLIQLIADGMGTEKIRDPNLLQHYLLEREPDLKELLPTISMERNTLSIQECRYIGRFLTEQLQHLYVYKEKDSLIQLLDSLDQTSFDSKDSLYQDIRMRMSRLLLNLQNTEVGGKGMIRHFNFSDDIFDDQIRLIVEKRKRPGAILQTGMQMFNAILAPGFLAGKFYVILGGTGKFKSGSVLNIADQIRRYNPQVIAYENGKRKTILFITCENSIEETVERLYDMYSGVDEDFINQDPESIIATLQTEGSYRFTDQEGIDIDLYYYSNMEISTGQIPILIQELDDNGKEVIVVILDYILRVQCEHDDYGDERVRLSYVAKELKSISQNHEIPVISPMQLNRDGNGILDAGLRDNKQDLAKFVGNSHIGNCWSIVEEADCVILINLERQRATGKLFLSVLRTKLRYKSKNSSLTYFNHPFTNEKEIRLAVDIYDEKPASVMSLASDLISVDEQELQEKQRSRPTMSSLRPIQFDDLLNG